MKPVFIIEHLEPKLDRWAFLEYERIAKIVGKKNTWFTNIRKGTKKLNNLGNVLHTSVKDLTLTSACVLDPQAPRLLTPQDAKHFKYFIIGGILGDSPPKKRTRKELTRFLPAAEKRNIGNKQFSTDNAAYVVHKIALGTPLNKIKYHDTIEIPIDKIASVILPYRYPLDKQGKPLMNQKIINYLKRKKGV